MKTTAFFPVFLWLMFAALNSQISSVFAQGALTPPGAPAPGMKTLAQVEPRTPVSSAPFIITNSGSYYLTTNLTVSTGDGIDINTNGVTLDLNGYTIASTAASATGTGILLASGLSDITIGNGHIRGSVTNNGSGVYNGGGFVNGIAYSGNAPANALVSRVSVSGCLADGIYLFGATVVEACTVQTAGSYGIFAYSIKSCSALDCGYVAIYGSEVSDSRGQNPGSGTGIYANFTAQNCFGSSNSGNGLYAATAQNCYGSSGTGYGVGATTAVNCYGSSSGAGYGITATTAVNCYGTISGSGYGVYVYLAQNCFGSSSSGTGLYATYIANGCTGSSASGTGLSAFIANGCHGGSSTGTAMNLTHNVNSY